MSAGRRILLAFTLGAALCLNAQAQARSSELSTLSALPLALSVAAPAALLSAGTVLTVVAVEASAEGSVWLLRRASDGVEMSLVVSGQLAGGLSVAAGTVVSVTTLGAGWLLSAAGQVIAFIPNEIGKALLHNERITR